MLDDRLPSSSARGFDGVDGNSVSPGVDGVLGKGGERVEGVVVPGVGGTDGDVGVPSSVVIGVSESNSVIDGVITLGKSISSSRVVNSGVLGVEGKLVADGIDDTAVGEAVYDEMVAMLEGYTQELNSGVGGVCAALAAGLNKFMSRTLYGDKGDKPSSDDDILFTVFQASACDNCVQYTGLTPGEHAGDRV